MAIAGSTCVDFSQIGNLVALASASFFFGNSRILVLVFSKQEAKGERRTPMSFFYVDQ